MTNPFSVLEEPHSQTKTKKKKTVERKKKTAKKPAEKKKPQVTKPTQQAPKRKPKLLFSSEKNEEPKVVGEKVAPVEKRSFDGPSGLKTYKRDNNKPYFNRNQGKGPVAKGGKRYNQRDRSVNRSGKRNAPYRKGGEGGKHSWTGRYIKKKPQEMNDEEWDKSIEIDKQKQKNEDSKKARVAEKSKKKVVKKKYEGKKEEKKDLKKTEEKGEKKDEKKDFKKGKRDFKKGKRDFKKGKKWDRKDKEEEVVEEESDDDDVGKTTYEEFIKNRKKPLTINGGQSRKAREGVTVQAKQLEFTRALRRNQENYMKVAKKKNTVNTVKKVEKTETKPKKKSKKKQLSTADFFKGPSKKKNFKGKGFKQKGQKKTIPNLKDNKNFPSLS